MYDIGNTKEYISRLLNWDTLLNIYTQEENERRVWHFHPFLYNKLFSETGDQSGILQPREDKKRVIP